MAIAHLLSVDLKIIRVHVKSAYLSSKCLNGHLIEINLTAGIKNAVTILRNLLRLFFKFVF